MSLFYCSKKGERRIEVRLVLISTISAVGGGWTRRGGGGGEKHSTLRDSNVVCCYCSSFSSCTVAIA